MANGSITSRNPVTGYIEFEAKLLQDIINYNNGNWSDYLNALGYAVFSIRDSYKSWLDEITKGGTCYPTQINFDTYDAFARLFASTHKLYKDLGLKFDKKLQPDALTDIIKKSDCK